jgi:hypothetical protein
MYEFKPTSWDQVQAYDTIVFNVETNPANKPRLRRMVLTGAPHVYADQHAAEHGTASLVGQYVTKSGARNKAYHSRWDHYTSARIGLVVSVQRHGEAPAGVAEAPVAEAPVAVEATPAPVKPLTPPMEAAMVIAREKGYIHTSDLRHSGVGTVVALMRRGLLREADPHRYGRHYLATTPAQAWDEVHTENERFELTPRFPEGTPEYAAYAAELKTELGKWVAGEAPYDVRPLHSHSFLPTMGSGPAYGPCQMRRCGLPYADDIHRTGIEGGDTVQRRGEVGPDHPVGIVTQVETGWSHAYVAFSGLAPCRVRLSTLVKVLKAEPVAVPTPTPAPTLAAEVTALRVWVDGRKRGDERTTTIMLTGSDIAHIHLIDALEIAIMNAAAPGAVSTFATPLKALRDAICDRIGLVRK